MLPTPPPATEIVEHTAIKRDFDNIDSLITELNAPKEQIIQKAPIPGSEQGLNVSEIGNEQPIVEISSEAAALSGEMVANTLDTVISLGASMYAKAPNREEYEAKPKEISNLGKAWAAVAQKMNFSIQDSPWFNLILLMVAVYAPILIRAKSDRREAILRAEMETMRQDQERRNLELKADIDKLRKESQA